MKIHKKYEYSFDYIQKKLKGKKDSFGMLMREIIQTGVCTECGTCAAVCPVLEWDRLAGQPKLVGKCTGCGICYNQCPHTITDPNVLMGKFKTGYVINTNIPEVIGAQDGGTVTSLLCYLFDEHLIDAAIVTKKNSDHSWFPVPQIITIKDEAIKASGSVYCHSQTVEALMDAVRENYRSIAFVGTPCNISAVKKMYNSSTGMLKYFMRANILTIGLFCMDSFAPEALYPFFERDGIELKKVKKMNISKGKFQIYYNEDDEPVKSYKIKDLNKFKSSSCNFCTDLTAEEADISVGSVGSGPNKNTVFARSGIGAEIIEDAGKKGYLTIGPFDAIYLKSILSLAKLKKVSQYNLRKRKAFIGRQVKEEEEPKIESKLQKEQKLSLNLNQIIESRRALRVRKEMNEEVKTLELSLTNTIGFILENLKIHIATINEVFEKNVWNTKIKELFPYEKIEINYPLEEKDGDLKLEKVLIKVFTGKYGKIYSKIYDLTPKKY